MIRLAGLVYVRLVEQFLKVVEVYWWQSLLRIYLYCLVNHLLEISIEHGNNLLSLNPKQLFNVVLILVIFELFDNDEEFTKVTIKIKVITYFFFFDSSMRIL